MSTAPAQSSSSFKATTNKTASASATMTNTKLPTSKNNKFKLWNVKAITDNGIVKGIEFLRIEWAQKTKSGQKVYTLEPAEVMRGDLGRVEVNGYIHEWLQSGLIPEASKNGTKMVHDEA
ncbi:uncharacterized protein RAG0_16660 [Rhynchosporium agropyri]|uniref:Uncharacterized protein n=1 Tax=Rhynchosporium agropyri TaxID=914238 RepID=A0A1E1LRD9_9HELO|nr:uncharacterized protein RAG0_16660 [Rhynchosporium agropyri]